jgi:transcription initiation factor TFIIF subunit alpha
MDIDSREDMADLEERETREQLRTERRRIREENQAQIAPTGKTQRPPAFQKKTEQVFRSDDTPAAAKAAQLRYEEAIPWHLEDFSGKSVWQGTYEAALSECHLALVPEAQTEDIGQPHFRLFPLEKYYRFKEKSKFKSYTLEEAEERMSKKFKEDRWSMNEKLQRARGMELAMKEGGLAKTEMSLRRGERNELMKASSATKRPAFKREGAGGSDEDDIDFNLEEEFADDEENQLFEGENDEVKEAEDKIRKD